jgi:glucose-1-phosphate thymidylyltransferase
LAIDRKNIQEDILVIAGDNLFHFSIRDFVQSAKLWIPDITLAAVDIQDRESAKKYGVLELEHDGCLARFLEKPSDPPSTLVSMGLYFFPGTVLERIKEYLSLGLDADAPGFFIKWLLGKEKVHGYVFRGIWYDIGDLNSYENANRFLTQSLEDRKAE